MKIRKREKAWYYQRIKCKPGNIITGSHLQESGDLCKPWPSNFSKMDNMTAYDGNYEYIEYYIHSEPYVQQPCFHIKNAVINHQYKNSTVETIETHRCSDGSQAVWCQTDTYSGFYGSGFPSDGYRLPDLPDLNQSHREALEFFASGCQPIVSNWAVNLTEISELIELARTAWNAFKLFKKLASEGLPYSWGIFMRKFANMSTNAQVAFLTKNVSKEAANAFLAYSFAIAPLLSDIKSTAETLRDLSRRIAFFRKNCKKPVKVRFSKDLSSAFPTQSVSYPPVPDSTDDISGVDKFRVEYAAKYTATAYAMYDVSKLSDNDIAFRLAKKAFGFADPLVFLWEKIPFSFVVDWFIKVGDYLSSLPSISTFPYTLSRVTHSLLVTQVNVHTSYWYVPNFYTPRVLRQQVTTTDLITLYDRKLDIPLTFSGLDTSLPGFQQLMLALALGRQFFK